MKDLPLVWSAWDVGKFFGDGKSSAYVTVEPNWKISPTTAGVPTGQTYRWFQSESGAERSEVEVPNIKSISIERSLDTDAASCTIEIYNQLMNPVGGGVLIGGIPQGLAGQLGNPGAFSPSRGTSAEAQSRWNQPDPSSNDWAIQNAGSVDQHGVIAPSQALAPMALLRTYQGYGGWVNGVAMSWTTAVASGYVAITGTWIVDATTIGSDGILRLKCRDAAKLLIDQFCYPPIAPTGGQNPYPIKYNRWVYTGYDPEWDPVPAAATNDLEVGLTYYNALSDYSMGGFTGSGLNPGVGPDFPVGGHYPSQSVDGDPNTYALSSGLASFEYWEYTVDAGDINEVWVAPWGGPYTVWVSVLEGTGTNAAWQGTEMVPPPNLGNPTIPFVAQAGLSYENGVWIILPRRYAAQRVRVTLNNGYNSGLSPNPNRSGLKEVSSRYHVQDSTITNGFAFSMAGFPGGDGAWVVSDLGTIFPLGDAPNAAPFLPAVFSATTVAAEEKPTPTYGFWTLLSSGIVNTYNGARFAGDPTRNVFGTPTGLNSFTDFVDMASTNTGNGYWLLRRSGEVWAFGDAVHHGSMTTTTAAAIAGDPTGNGYWIVDSSGRLQSFGTADVMPNLEPGGKFLQPAGSSAMRDLVALSNGTGLWGLWDTGAITTVGSATSFGDAANFYNPADPTTTQFWAMSKLAGDGGYRLLRVNGSVYYFGDATSFGGLEQPRVRTTGNYADYSDIIKDLLRWSGFLLYGTNVAHGNIETTGVWSEEDLTEDIFDKKSIMDIITMIKEIVGYNFWIDDEGGVRFETPNWFAPGNFFEDGRRTTFVPTIDERSHLTSYSAQIEDSQLRSEVTIANANPSDKTNVHTIVSTVTPPGAFTLRGMQKPAIWFNEVFLRASEQQVMAELIAMHIFFSMRQGNVECTANPCIQLNDQVRIYERISSETYVHYVRAISTSHDLDTGIYKMTLQTNWLGDGDVWAIAGGGLPGGGGPGPSPTEQTFNYVGSTRTFTVPLGVTSLNFEVAGGQGANGDGALGGGGSRGCLMTFTLPVFPGQVLTLYVGGQGDSAGGSGGLAGIADALGTHAAGGAGGGSSRVFNYQPPVGQNPPIYTYFGVAAGGGGGGGGIVQSGGVGGPGIGDTNMFNSGTPGMSANPGLGGFGGGGAQPITGGAPATAGGAGGSGSTVSPNFGVNGATGTSLAGGGGGGSSSIFIAGGSGGGGGGGWFGGGGGGSGYSTAGGGGGGGFSHAYVTATNVIYYPGFRGGNGYIKISWTNPVPVGLGPDYQAEDATLTGG